MNYHYIKTDDMNNGDGLRVTLFLSACCHQCYNCHNPETWNEKSGMTFDNNAKIKLFNELSKDYISGITFSGGDPLHKINTNEVKLLIEEIKDKFPNKTIWLYSGYTWEQIFTSNNINRQLIINMCDVFVDGKYIDSLKNVNYKWAGSTNQRVININKSLQENKVILWD